MIYAIVGGVLVAAAIAFVVLRRGRGGGAPHWHVTVPDDKNSDGNADKYDSLKTIKPWVTVKGKEITLYCPAHAPTTKNSNSSRAELKEQPNYKLGSKTHTLEARVRMDRLENRFSIAQFKSGERRKINGENKSVGELVHVHVRKDGSVYAYREDEDRGPSLQKEFSGVRLREGDEYTVKIVVNKKEAKVTINGVSASWSVPKYWQKWDMEFHLGIYNHGAKDGDGKNTACQVTVLDWKLTHK